MPALIPIAATHPTHFAVLDEWRHRCTTGRRAIRNCPLLTMKCMTVGEAVLRLEAAVRTRRTLEPCAQEYKRVTDAIAGEAAWLRAREPK